MTRYARIIELMNLKRLYLLGYGVLAFVALIMVGVLVYRAYSFDKRVGNLGNDLAVTETAQNVDLRIDFGEGRIASYSGVTVNPPVTVLNLTRSIAESNFLTIVSEQKPLGTIIKSINGLMAGNGNFWLVYQNGDLITNGLDQQKVSTNDKIEIRYNKL